jgi:hypothetical protein
MEPTAQELWRPQVKKKLETAISKGK